MVDDLHGDAPKEKKCIVAGCLVIKGGKVLLLNHAKIGAWLPPGGHMEGDEFPYETALRETKEETGLDVELIHEDAGMHRDDLAYTLDNPFTIMHERVPYKTKPPHIHFDMIYIAKVVGGTLNFNKESTGIGWFGPEELKTLDTLPNVRRVALDALEKYGRKL